VVPSCSTMMPDACVCRVVVCHHVVSESQELKADTLLHFDVAHIGIHSDLDRLGERSENPGPHLYVQPGHLGYTA
jgi:hypothetical protein